MPYTKKLNLATGLMLILQLNNFRNHRMLKLGRTSPSTHFPHPYPYHHYTKCESLNDLPRFTGQGLEPKSSGSIQFHSV